jgi:hypothetical protein
MRRLSALRVAKLRELLSALIKLRSCSSKVAERIITGKYTVILLEAWIVVTGLGVCGDA